MALHVLYPFLYTLKAKIETMAKFYQHSDEVIEAARVLRSELIADAPFGNEADARAWAYGKYPAVFRLARQTTEGEEQKAVGHGLAGAL